MRPRSTARRMQGELGTGIFVAAVAAAVVGFGIYAVANSSDDTTGGDAATADYDAVCVDHQNNRVDDTNCASAPEDYSSDVLAPTMPYGYVYVPTRTTSAFVIPAVGRPMPTGSYTFRAPTTIAAPGGSVQAAVIQRAPASGGNATPSANGSIQRNGFGVKTGSGTSGGGTAKGGGGTAKGGTSGGS